MDLAVVPHYCFLHLGMLHQSCLVGWRTIGYQIICLEGVAGVGLQQIAYDRHDQ
jgi:hypothetical protein